MGKDKELLIRIQDLCRFANKHPGDLKRTDVEVVHHMLGAEKIDGSWDIIETRVFQRNVREALRYVVVVMKNPNIHLEIEPPKKWHRLVNWGGRLKLITRWITGPNDMINFRAELNKPDSKNMFAIDDLLQDLDIDEVEGEMPLVVFRAIELLTFLPPNTLRVCAEANCENVFASLHKSQAYCSVRCRSRRNTYASRRRAKEAK